MRPVQSRTQLRASCVAGRLAERVVPSGTTPRAHGAPRLALSPLVAPDAQREILLELP